MNISISRKNCHFFTNKDKRKVVCVLEVNPDLVNAFLWNNGVDCFTDILDQYGTIPRRYIGIATCSSEDEWNQETGELIAYSRAKEKLNRVFFAQANKVFDAIDERLNAAMDKCNMLGEAWVRNDNNLKDRIRKRLGEEIPAWEPAQ